MFNLFDPSFPWQKSRKNDINSLFRKEKTRQTYAFKILIFLISQILYFAYQNVFKTLSYVRHSEKKMLYLYYFSRNMIAIIIFFSSDSVFIKFSLSYYHHQMIRTSLVDLSFINCFELSYKACPIHRYR